jgi:pimeloyl-ACP methyl ester carboxylesterase
MLRLFLLVSFVLLASLAPASAADLPRRAAFGIGMANALPPDVRSAQKLTTDEGALITLVQPGLTGDAAGLKAGDVLVTLDDKRVTSPADVSAVIRSKKTGDMMAIGYVRNAARATTSVAVKATPYETVADLDITYGAVATRDGVRRTIVTRPRASDRLPAVILAGGLGCYSVDFPLDEKHGYRQLLYGITRAGFVTMRVEKSGMGDSTGKPCAEVDLETEVDGLVAGLRALKKLRGVDPSRIFIFGHSMGGVSGPLAALKEPVKGLFVSETLGITWYEYELINTRRQLKLGGETPANIGSQMMQKQWCSHRHLIERAPRAEILKARPDCAEFITYPAADAFMQQVAAQNLPELWLKLKGVDVGVLYGAADFVTGRDESMAIVEAANAVRPGSGEYIELPDMDHFLLQSPSQAASLQRMTSGGAAVFHPKLVEIVTEWLKSKSR